MSHCQIRLFKPKEITGCKHLANPLGTDPKGVVVYNWNRKKRKFFNGSMFEAYTHVVLLFTSFHLKIQLSEFARCSFKSKITIVSDRAL